MDGEVETPNSEQPVAATDSDGVPKISKRSKTVSRGGLGKGVSRQGSFFFNRIQTRSLSKRFADEYGCNGLKKAFHDMIDSRSKTHKQRLKDGEGHPFPRVRRLVLSNGFELMLAALIISNCVFIGVQAEHPKPQGVEAIVMRVLDNLFTTAFLVDLILRTLGYGWTMFVETDAQLDFVLVALSVVALWIVPWIGVEADILRKLTILRTLRLIRLARSVRFRPEFKEMWALLKGLTDSGETLFWTYVMICIVLYFFAIMATSLIGRSADFEDNATAQEYFGDVLRSMLTLFQVMTLDSWNLIMRDLMKVSGGVVIFFLLFISVAVFCLMNLITAVIVEHAFTTAKDEEADKAARMQLQKEEELNELKRFFVSLDLDGSGKLTRDELRRACRSRKVKQKLRSLDLMEKDINELWDILADGDADGELDAEEFVNGIRRLKGEARAKDILRLYRELTVLEENCGGIEHSIDTSKERMQVISEKLQRARVDIAASHRTMERAKDAVKLASKTQAQK